MPKIEPQRVKVRRRWWMLLSLRWSDGNQGYCDNPETPAKQIRVLDTLEGREMLDTLLHEIFHAGNWDIKEEAVNEFCSDAAKILYDKLGYRAPWDED
jgi:hypothetical protein